MKAHGIWIAFGLSIGLHAVGFGIAKNAPSEPSSASSVSASLRLIKAPQTLIETPKQAVKLQSNNISVPTQPDQPNSYPDSQYRKVEQLANQEDQKDTQKAASIFSRIVRYLDSKEVDLRSEPISNWKLRTEGLTTTDVVVIQLTIFISDDGTLDKFEILHSSISQTETESLLADLVLTPFKPASRDGKPVPSQQNVEILLDPSPQIFRLPNPFNSLPPQNK